MGKADWICKQVVHTKAPPHTTRKADTTALPANIWLLQALHLSRSYASVKFITRPTSSPLPTSLPTNTTANIHFLKGHLDTL